MEVGQAEEGADAEHALAQRDAVLEPSAIENAQIYVRTHGSDVPAIKRAIQLLSESYVGYARMASFTCRWLASARSALYLNNSEGSKDSEGSERFDCAQVDFLAELVHKRFDSQKAELLVQQPHVANSLLHSPRARRICLQLAHTHTESTFLEGLIVSSWRSGYKEDVMSLGSTAANSLSVFSEIVHEHVQAVCSASSPEAQMAAIQGLCRLCKHNQVAYTVCLLTLTVLQRSASSDDMRRIFRRASQELERAAVAQDAAGSASTVAVVTPLCTKIDQHQLYRIIVQLLSSHSGNELELLRSLCKLVPALSDEAASINEHESSKHEDCDHASSVVEALRYFRLIERLAHIVFSYDVRRNMERWSKSADLLCYACNPANWRSTRSRLETLLEHLDGASRGLITDREAASRLVSSDAICAWGASYYAEQALRHPEHSSSIRRREITTALSVFLLESCRAFRTARNQVLRAVKGGLESVAVGQVEAEDVHKQLLDLCVIMSQVIPGCAVKNVLPMTEAWAAQVGEPSLVRYFTTKLINACGEPRSAKLVGGIIRTLSNGGSLRHDSLDDSTRELLRKSFHGDGMKDGGGGLRVEELQMADRLLSTSR